MKTFMVSGEKSCCWWFTRFKEWCYHLYFYNLWFPNVQAQRKTQSAKNTLRLFAPLWPEKNSPYGLLCVGLIPALPAKQLPSNPAFPTTFPHTRCVPRKKYST